MQKWKHSTQGILQKTALPCSWLNRQKKKENSGPAVLSLNPLQEIPALALQ